MEKMEPDDIELNSIDTLFEYEKNSRIIDSLNTEELRKFAKLYCKLYLMQQEVVRNIGTISI